MTPEQEIYRANRAKEVIENEIYIEAFDMIHKEIADQWTNSPARDREGRESLWLMQKLLTRLQTALQSTMDAGKLAVAELTHKQTLLERAKDLLS